MIQARQDVLSKYSQNPLARWSHRLRWILTDNGEEVLTVHKVSTLAKVPRQAVEPQLAMVLSQLLCEPRGAVSQGSVTHHTDDSNVTRIPKWRKKISVTALMTNSTVCCGKQILWTMNIIILVCKWILQDMVNRLNLMCRNNNSPLCQNDAEL